MRSDGSDQAEGLRRLLALNQTQVVTVVAGKAGAGRTSATLNLAAALAGSGKSVLVLDENTAPNNLPGRMGLSARHDLLDVVHGKCGLCDVVLAAKGFGVLPAARAVRALGQLDADGQSRLKEALDGASYGADVVLVDAAIPVPAGMAGPFASCMVGAAVLLVIVEATPGGITESYALIKRLALQNATRQFGIAINRPGSEQAALTVFENMAKVARRNLSVGLAYLGCIPPDDNLKCAMQAGKPVIEAFPATAATCAYLALAQKLLRLPVQPAEADSGGAAIVQNLIRQASRPAYCEAPGMG